MTQEDIKYVYAGGEKTRDVASYCEDLNILATYRPYKDRYVWDTQRALLVTLKDIPFLPRCEIAAIFARSKETKRLFWDFDSWQEGEEKVLNTDGHLAWDPGTFSIEISFSDTDYIHKAGSWNVKGGPK